MRTVILLLFLLSLLACDSPTMESRFRDFSEVYCGRMIECSLMPAAEHRACNEMEVESSCFEPRDCFSRDYYLDEDLWVSCLDTLDSYDCEQMARELVPVSCVNAWRPPGHRI